MGRGIWVGAVFVALAGIASSAGVAAAADEARALGFEDLADWQLVAGFGPVSSVAPLSEGSSALRIAGSGWRELKSPGLTFDAAGPSLKLDVGVGAAAAGWETLAVIVQIPSAGIYWHDLGTKSLSGMTPAAFKTFEFALPSAVTTALANGAEATFRVAINGNLSITLDHGTLSAPPPAPPPPDESISASCTSRDLVLTDLEADFRDIWAGREDVATGKRASWDAGVRLIFNKPVQPQRLTAQMVGLTNKSGDCVDAVGDPIAGDTLHEVRLVGAAAVPWRAGPGLWLLGASGG